MNGPLYFAIVTTAIAAWLTALYVKGNKEMCSPAGCISWVAIGFWIWYGYTVFVK